MTKQERKDIQIATIYGLRRFVAKSGKESFTVEELCDMVDSFADSLDRE